MLTEKHITNQLTGQRITTNADVKQSIADIRPIYSDMSDEAFAIMYSRKYKVPYKAVMAYLEQSDESH